MDFVTPIIVLLFYLEHNFSLQFPYCFVLCKQELYCNVAMNSIRVTLEATTWILFLLAYIYLHFGKVALLKVCRISY